MYRFTFFLTLALAGGEWAASRPGHFTPGEKAPGTQWIGGWVDPRAGLDDLKKRKFLTLPGLELRPLGHPARSQSPYRLRYPDSLQLHVRHVIYNIKLQHPVALQRCDFTFCFFAVYVQRRLISRRFLFIVTTCFSLTGHHRVHR
jgi:hypothetical protein